MEINTIKVSMEEIVLLFGMLEVQNLLLWKSITGLLDNGWQRSVSGPTVF
jgi:hypothetical protein